MKWNNLNVLKYGSMSKYPSQWLNNIKLFFRRLKYAYQRIVYGYCAFDLYDLNSFYTILFVNSLKEFGKEPDGHPIGLTYEQWLNILDDIAEHFSNCSLDNDNTELAINENKAFEYMQSFIDHHEYEKTDHNAIRQIVVYKDEDRYLLAQIEWLKATIELNDFRESERDKGFELLKKYFYDLWD